ncbi:Glycosyltransferase involved in cell wall bisynthesis [Persephonella hydrogeniphila]|uniref:Glycosyltransferase involved in cell wall bisynthesis n=1 Tax=Persephonella hydrogeniphila TaxID=198703 RepID=A0A285NLI7_9AQUI|nr:glycosyltransferase family 4 protein [Persephonella hydrogeniphila]SNZ10394.1 Glycosyltransferase involved in cell wall bisynthesis [Persephonella hydrogeniphila]
MKVLQVVDGYGWGGTKEQVYLTTRELKKKGIDVHIALSFQYDEMVKKLKPYGVPVHYFENHIKNARYRWENYRRLIDIIDRNDFDIVVGNSPHAFDYVRISKIFLKTRPKIINVKRSGRVPSFLSKVLKYSAADRIVVVSKNVEKYLREKNFLPEKLVTIESGVDLSRFKPEPERKLELRKKLGFPLDKKIFVNVANWNPEVKAQDRLFEAFVKAGIPDSLLIFVGKDTDTKIKELSAKYNTGNILGLGFRTDIPDILNASDYFVLSSYLEGIAGALLQAMATGKIVLSTLAGGIDEYLLDGYNGFSVNVGDFEALKEKMIVMSRLSDEEYSRISKNAVETAQNYSIEKTADKYIKLFEEMVYEK